MSEENKNFEDKNEGEEKENGEYWTKRILNKVTSFIGTIDSDLDVSAEKTIIHPNKWESYEDTVLHFTHDKNPQIEWTMDVGHSEDYVENELEGVVRKIYEERMGEAGRE